MCIIERTRCVFTISFTMLTIIWEKRLGSVSRCMLIRWYIKSHSVLGSHTEVALGWDIRGITLAPTPTPSQSVPQRLYSEYVKGVGGGLRGVASLCRTAASARTDLTLRRLPWTLHYRLSYPSTFFTKLDNRS